MGERFRAEVNAEGAFERLGRELAGFYRIGIEKEPAYGDSKGRRLKVQVARPSVTVRARDIFDVPVYEDRDVAVRADECRRTIRERKPARPSTRLATMVEADLTTTAKQRHTHAPRLIHLLRGDLDWIAMKCLEKGSHAALRQRERSG